MEGASLLKSFIFFICNIYVMYLNTIKKSKKKKKKKNICSILYIIFLSFPNQQQVSAVIRRIKYMTCLYYSNQMKLKAQKIILSYSG